VAALGNHVTTFRSEKQTCCVCGQDVDCSVLTSTSTFGSPDLDLRPPEMERSTIEFWLNECPDCGFTNENLACEIDGARDIIFSNSFRKITEHLSIPGLARRFVQHSLLHEKNPRKAAVSLLHAAWICDDLKETQWAKSFRTRCAHALRSLRLDLTRDPDQSLSLVLIDILRRVERFDKAVEVAATFEQVHVAETLRSLIQFQGYLCGQKDIACHTLAEALRMKL